MDATCCPTGPQGRAKSRLRTTHRTGVRHSAAPRLLETKSDNERANRTMKIKKLPENRVIFVRGSQARSNFQTDYTTCTDGTIARKSGEFQVRQQAFFFFCIYRIPKDS